MARREVVYHVILPMAAFGVYVTARLLRLVPAEFGGVAFSEHGVFEIGTVLFFALAASFAVALCIKSRGIAPKGVRFLFFLYALVACWVAHCAATASQGSWLVVQAASLVISPAPTGRTGHHRHIGTTLRDAVRHEVTYCKSDKVQFHLGWNEIREYYWRVLAVLYVLIIWQRLIGSSRGATPDRCASAHDEMSAARLQAA